MEIAQNSRQHPHASQKRHIKKDQGESLGNRTWVGACSSSMIESNPPKAMTIHRDCTNSD